MFMGYLRKICKRTPHLYIWTPFPEILDPPVDHSIGIYVQYTLESMNQKINKKQETHANKLS